MPRASDEDSHPGALGGLPVPVALASRSASH